MYLRLERYTYSPTFILFSIPSIPVIRTKDALHTVIAGIDNGITKDFTAMDIKQALHHLGEITGQITTDDLLDNPPVVGQVFSVHFVLESRCQWVYPCSI
jgi:hypothetical protein